MRFSLVYVPFFILTFCLCYGNASFWDGVVGISQLKSAAQYIGGDRKGARETNRNFWNQMPVVSQLKSTGQLIMGDAKGAKTTQVKFLQETVEPVLENTPVIGHIKSMVHLAMGDKHRAYGIFRAASISAIMSVAASTLGPIGAINAGITSQGLLSMWDSLQSKRMYEPMGAFEYAHNIRKKNIGDHIDFLADIAGTFYGGRFIKSNGIKFGRKHGWLTWKGEKVRFCNRRKMSSKTGIKTPPKANGSGTRSKTATAKSTANKTPPKSNNGNRQGNGHKNRNGHGNGNKKV